MQRVRWLFFAFLTVVGMLLAALVIAPAAAPVTKHEAGTLYLAYYDDIKSLDPIEVSDASSARMAGNIYECILNYDYDARPFKLIPQLAAEMPSISGDGLVYTIRLRKGIHLYDPDKEVFPEGKGPEVKAGDFVYAWKRVLNFKESSPNSNHLEHLKGSADWRKYTEETPEGKIDWNRPFEGAVAVDEHTLRVTLEHPLPQFLYILAHLPTAPVARAAVEKFGKNYRDHPIGTGAFCMRAKDHLRQQRITMIANPIYRGRPDIDGLTTLAESEHMPFIKKAQYDFFNEPLPAWFLFRTGQIDAVGDIPKETFSSVMRQSGEITEEMKKEGVSVIVEDDPTIRFIGFNMRDPVIGKNAPLRRAMSLAIDREKYIRVYLSGKGRVPVGVIPPGFELYDPKTVNIYAKYNMPAARTLLREAEKLNGGPIPRVTLLMPGTDTLLRQMGDFVKAKMTQLGLNFDVEYTNWARFLEIVETRKTAQMFYNGWIADWPDEQNILQLFWSKNIAEGGLNSFNFDSPEFDRVYEQAVVMQPGPKRLDLYRKLQAIINDDVPCILVYSDIIMAPQHHWLTDMKLSEYPHQRRMHLKLDSDTRAKWLAERGR